MPVGLRVQRSQRIVKLKIAIEGKSSNGSRHGKATDDVEADGSEIKMMLAQVLITKRHQQEKAR